MALLTNQSKGGGEGDKSEKDVDINDFTGGCPTDLPP